MGRVAPLSATFGHRDVAKGRNTMDGKGKRIGPTDVERLRKGITVTVSPVGFF